MLGASVPKAAIHEDRQASMAKDEVGLSAKGRAATPAGNALGAEKPDRSLLGGSVAL